MRTRSVAACATLLLGMLLTPACSSGGARPAPVVDPDTSVPTLFEVRVFGSSEVVCYVWNAGGPVPSGELCVPDGAEWPSLEPTEMAIRGHAAPGDAWCSFLAENDHEDGIVMDWQGDFPPRTATNARRACK